ncbi:MAG: undecaprenyl-diphosphate phosphatase [Actinomycetota bacterium]
MLEAVVWGVIQGITEFLPISSDGHLVLIPAFLDLAPPDLATTAVLHLGTLMAMIVFFRRELWSLTRAGREPAARRLLALLFVGTLPAGLALFVEDQVAALQKSVRVAAVFLIVTGVVLTVASRLPKGERTIDQARLPDAFLTGIAQVLAILPGLSRSGVTIATAMGRGFDRTEAARFSFLLGVPAVAGAGLLELVSLLRDGGVPGAAWMGVAVAGVVGYLSISFLLRMLERTGLTGYAIYCYAVGLVALLVL